LCFDRLGCENRYSHKKHAQRAQREIPPGPHRVW
jgi:hypothetical protein